MSKAQIIIDILLAVGVMNAVLGSLGVLLMKDFYERLHYMAPQSTVSIACFAAAVVVDKHFSAAGIKAVMIAIVIIVMNAVLTHATARAARVRQFGRWISDVTEVRGTGDNSTAGLNSQPQVDVIDQI